VTIQSSPHPRRGAAFPYDIEVPELGELDYSAICGVARLVEVVTKHRSKWFQKPSPSFCNYGWVLADVRPLREPVECDGILGLWKVSPRTLRSIKRQLPTRIAAII
jgi:hypothetical protein